MKFIATLFVLLFFSTHSSALPIVFKEQLPYVEATINGKTIELMFDLGADAPVALTGSEIAATNVTVLDQTLKYGMADGSNFEVPLIRIDNLKLGPWEKSNVAGHEFRFLGGANSARHTGHVGSALFAESILHINYSAESIEISERIPDRCPRNWKKIDMTYGIPRLQAVMNGKSYWLALDTGAQGNFLPHAEVDTSMMKVTTSDGESMVMPFRGLNILQAPFDGFLGYDFFLAHSVCLDFANSRVSYGPST